MKRSGAYLAVYALEQIGVTHTFGIPGVHNIELYDALNSSQKIVPILTTHENGATFAADAMSRTSGNIGVAMIVPAAGLANGMSGIGEAYLDGIPALIISGGVRRDSGKHYQLHQMDQGRVLDGIIKKYYLIRSHEEVVSTIYEAYETAVSGEPGPVFIEIPAEIQLFEAEVSALPAYRPKPKSDAFSSQSVQEAVRMLTAAKRPGIYVGWGAVDAMKQTREIADLLGAPVATTLQGLSAFPARHPLHVGVGFGPAGLPAAQKAFEGCDCLLAAGLRFGELATGSYGMPIPDNLIHVDINPEVFNKNYPAKIAIQGDATRVLSAIRAELAGQGAAKKDVPALTQMIREEKARYFGEWTRSKNDKLVSPGHFFQTLRELAAEDALMVVDDGTHTFLAAELFPVNYPRHFISPTDFNCMGYCVPAAIAAKLGSADKQVLAVVGDGAFLMTGMELLTAGTYDLGIPFFVFHDGELGQISQFQKTPLNRKTCTVIGQIRLEGIAQACGAEYIPIRNDHEVREGIQKALSCAQSNRPALVDVYIDYSRKTRLTKGVLKVNLSRFPLKEKIRFIGRAVKRHVLG